MVQASVYGELLAVFEAGNADVLPVLVDALFEGVEGVPGSFSQIMTRATKRGGTVRESEPVKNSYALVNPGESVTLIGTRTESVSTKGEDGRFTYAIVEKPYVCIFKVGDVAEYDSWNMSYYGTITSIGPKSVTIVKDSGKRTARLDLERFSFRNSRFDLEKAVERNHDVMMYA